MHEYGPGAIGDSLSPMFMSLLCDSARCESAPTNRRRNSDKLQWIQIYLGRRLMCYDIKKYYKLSQKLIKFINLYIINCI